MGLWPESTDSFEKIQLNSIMNLTSLIFRFSVNASHFCLFCKDYFHECFGCLCVLFDAWQLHWNCMGRAWYSNRCVTWSLYASEPIPNLFFITITTLNLSGLHCFYQIYKLRIACFYCRYLRVHLYRCKGARAERAALIFTSHTCSDRS